MRYFWMRQVIGLWRQARGLLYRTNHVRGIPADNPTGWCMVQSGSAYAEVPSYCLQRVGRDRCIFPRNYLLCVSLYEQYVKARSSFMGWLLIERWLRKKKNWSQNRNWGCVGGLSLVIPNVPFKIHPHVISFFWPIDVITWHGEKIDISIPEDTENSCCQFLQIQFTFNQTTTKVHSAYIENIAQRQRHQQSVALYNCELFIDSTNHPTLCNLCPEGEFHSSRCNLCQAPSVLPWELPEIHCYSILVPSLLSESLTRRKHQLNSFEELVADYWIDQSSKTCNFIASCWLELIEYSTITKTMWIRMDKYGISLRGQIDWKTIFTENNYSV